jgi:hypothetical protein
MASHNDTNGNDRIRWVLVGGLLVVAMFSAYKFASASSGQPVVRQTAPPKAAAGCGAGGSEGASCTATTSGACACASGSSQPATNGVTGPRVDGTATRVGGIQTITVKVTTVYSPNVIHLATGVPASITFSEAQGCTSRVQSRQLGFAEDLSTGSKSVTIENPRPGTYDFACGMNMVHGKILVE